MKKPIQSMFAVAALALSALAAQAQTAPKILVVDLAKIFDTHYKTQEQQAKLQADEAKAQDQLSAITKEGEALVAEYKDLDDLTKSATASVDAKDKAQADEQKKAEEINQKRQEQQAFVTNTQRTLQQRFQTFKTLMIEEISKTAVDIAKAHGATFLLDKSGPTLVGVSNVLYFEPDLDITDEVIAAINKDRPAVTPTPTAAAATSDAPKITVPSMPAGN
ncbi:MAG TPA: OmpH family outer membrane protein [Opitutaceae bacterium]|nr:OmpH family outer membrane protein [Opitutaceae bacterium]